MEATKSDDEHNHMSPHRRKTRRGYSGEEAWVGMRPVTETTREREVYRHLEPWARAYNNGTLHRLAFPANDRDEMPTPEGCADTALAALAQLAALRLNVRRCLISLITSEMEFVLAEATRTMNLQYDTVVDAHDKAWLGTSSFLRADGINDIAVNDWRRARRYRMTPDDEEHYYTEGRSPHWCIFSDARSNDQCKVRAFARRAPSLRFYCSVPLRTPDGTVLGSYTIMDDRPRIGVSAAEMTLLEDMADTVAHHLDAAVIASQSHRSERLIQGLSAFNKGQHSLRQWWMETDVGQGHRGGRHQNRSIDPDLQAARLDEDLGKQEVDTTPPAFERRTQRAKAKADGRQTRSVTSTKNDGTTSTRKADSVAMEDFGQGQPQTTPETPVFLEDQHGEAATKKQRLPRQLRAQQSYSSLSSPPSGFDLAEALRETYGRASNLIREAVNAEAVVVVAPSLASRRAARMRRTSDAGDTETSAQSSSNVEPDLQTPTSDSDTSGAGASTSSACKLKGFSTRSKTSLADKDSSHNFKLAPDDLAKLIRRYPRGRVFHFLQAGDLASSSGEEYTEGSQSDRVSTRKQSRQRRETTKLGKVMVGARTAVFYPLWESNGERCHSAIFLWSTDSMRFFDSNEVMLYLSAFAHSMGAEVIRLETLAADQAKGNFISSVSHELRSPLHGVLAGVELLQDSELNSYQREMAHMIAMAGRTLLDTVNHILDYSKISSSGRQQRKLRVTEQATRHTTASVGEDEGANAGVHIDLAQLTEEVVETTVAAFRYQHFTKSDIHSNSFDDSSSDDRPRHKPKGGAETSTSPISVVVNIAWRPNGWVVKMSPGSWTRILTNLLGNALKYTERGTVSIRLHTIKTDSHNDRVRLVIEDTGPGISEHFLTNDLFVPFRQENSFSVGTGLGLSIVKKLANEIHGDLNVTSEQGPTSGTRVTLEYNASFADVVAHRQLDEKRDGKISRALHEMQLRRIKLLDVRSDIEGEQHMHTGFPNTPLGASFTTMAKSWLHCEIDSDGAVDEVGPEFQICAVSESDFYLLDESDSALLSDTLTRLASQGTQLLVLGDSVRSTFGRFAAERFQACPLFVHQPIGPRKLMSTIAFANDVSTPLDVRDFALHDLSQSGKTRRASGPTSASNDPRQRPATTPRNRPSAGSKHETPPRTPRARQTSAKDYPFPRTISRDTDPQSSDTQGSELGTQEPALLDPRQHAHSSGDAKRGSSILLVEDNAINMKLLVALMIKMKLSYDCAEHGGKALEVYKANPLKHALVLMDMSMPVMDGFEATAKIREVETERRLPRCMIVALTGVTSADAIERAQACGVDRYFTKPIRMKALGELWKEITGPAVADATGGSMADDRFRA